MPFAIVRNDITLMKADAIVNTANPHPVIGAGTDSAIHEKAGPALLAARKKIGDIPVGDAAVTPGFLLPAKYVIHVSGPVWRDGQSGEEALLRQCYDRALELASERKCESVAFPLLAAGTYGFPKDRTLRIAEAAFRDFLSDHEMMIWLVVFDRQSFQVSEALFRSVESYLDETFVEEQLRKEYGSSHHAFGRTERRREAMELEDACFDSAPAPAMSAPAQSESESGKRNLGRHFRRERETDGFAGEETAMSIEREFRPGRKPDKTDLEERLRKLDRGFSETLLALIDASGEKDSDVYKRANVDRKLFSKIRNNRDYKPSKPTVLAFAFALGLDLAQTRDLLEKAGYALSHSSRFDVIVEYFLLRREYDLFQVNEVLFAFDQPLIGA